MDDKNKKTILLIEDDVFVRDLYVRSFTKAGYNIEVAADGDEGFKKSHEDKFDLILLDIMLPKKNGIDLLREIKEGEEIVDTPVFLLTNLGQETIIKEAFDMGAEGYFLKARLLPEEITQHVTDFFETGEASEDLKQV